MLEFKVKGHIVTVSRNEIHVTRTNVIGGIPKTITKSIKEDITFIEGVRSINKIIQLDDDIFNLIGIHQKEQKND